MVHLVTVKVSHHVWLRTDLLMVVPMITSIRAQTCTVLLILVLMLLKIS